MVMTDVAAKISRPHTYVSAYESGQRRLDVVQLMEVARALGTSLTAITEALTSQPTPPVALDADDQPDLAETSHHEPPPRQADRDAWYRAECSRLSALLRTTRENIRPKNGKQLAQEDVAGRLDVPQSFVSKYETAKRRLDLVEFELVATALDSTALDLVRLFERDAPAYGTATD